MNTRKKKILTIIVLAVTAIFLVLPAVGFSILKWGVLPPEKLTPLVIRETNKFLDAHLECERIELTYFETWPYLGVHLTNGRLISHAAEDSTAHEEALSIPSDSLLRFSKLLVSLQPADYLFGGTVTIKNITVDNLRFYGYVNEHGRANWDIYQSDPDSSTSDKKPLPPIDLQKVRITNGHFMYDNRQADLYTEIGGFFLNLDGSLSNGNNKIDIETGSSSILFSNPSYTLKNKLALKLKSQLLLSDNYNKVTLKGAELMINNLPFTADGSFAYQPETNLSQIDMDMGLKVSDLNDLLHFIPEAYFQDRDKTLAKGSVTLEGSIHGSLGDNIVPTVNLCCKIDEGAYHVKGVKQGIDTLQMDLDLHLNGLYPDSSYIALEQLLLKGLNTSLDLEAHVTNLLRNPAIRATMNGKVDFTRLAQEFLNPDTLLVEGVMDANLSASFTVDDLLSNKYSKIHAAGNMNIENLKAFSEHLGFDVYITDTHFSVDSTHQGSSFLDSKELIKIALTIDSMNIKYKDEINTNISKLDIQARTSSKVDTASVIPLTARVKFDQFRTRLPDSVWLVAGNTLLQGGLKPSASDKQVPVLAAAISVDTLKYLFAPMKTGLVMAKNTIHIEALPLRDARRQQRIAKAGTESDSTVKRTRRTAMPAQVRTDTTSSTNQLLRRWEVRGSILFNEARAFSRLFPIPIKMEQTTVKFNTNDITLTDANLHLGQSNFVLNGKIYQIRQAMLRGGKLKGEFSMASDYIDCNQLMQALNSGMLYSEQQSSAPDNNIQHEAGIALLNTETLADSISSAVIDTTDQLFVIPDYLDMTLSTNAKLIDFNDLKLENVKGAIILRDQSINLSNLAMHSNIGCGNLTMVYTAKNRQSASAGFDLDMEDVLVDKLIGLYPAIDTLVPMLRSFEGVVDCQMTATCQIDSTLSVILPSLHSACYLHGENMVLLDGETFTEISKTLMFKNKKRNVIDSISVDLSIKDNKIEVFPFLVQMDRYKVAVGGTHNLDMTFNYHLSVLKSPVPFKLGIDITGNLDDFKYKIVKCRYKDLFKATKETGLDSTRTNIRESIRDAIRKQIKEAAPELKGSLSENQMHSHEQKPTTHEENEAS